MPESADSDQALKEYGVTMRQNRTLLGLSLREAAEKAGVSKNTIMRLESGLPVNWSTHVKISRAYGRVPATPNNRRTGTESGENYSKQPLETRPWISVRIGKDGAAEVIKNSESVDQQERNRMGWYNLATHFISPLRCRREGSRFIAMITEIFAPTDVSQDVSGERFLLGIRGSVRVKVGSESFLLSEGEAATIDSTLPTGFEPANPVPVGSEAPLLLHVVLP